MAAARRELSEETGASGGTWRELATIVQAPGLTDAGMTIFFADDVVRGTFSAPDISASGKVSGTVSGGDHVVLVFQYLTGAVAGYAETWDGHVNASVSDFQGTTTPNNGTAAGTFGLQK